jgi:hypothetical protein
MASRWLTSSPPSHRPPVLVPPRAPRPRLTTTRTDVTQLPDKATPTAACCIRPHIPSNPSVSASSTRPLPNPHARNSCPLAGPAANIDISLPPLRDPLVAPALHQPPLPMLRVLFVAVAPRLHHKHGIGPHALRRVWSVMPLLRALLVVPLSTPVPMFPLPPSTHSIAILLSAGPSLVDSCRSAATIQLRLPHAHGVPSSNHS